MMKITTDVVIWTILQHAYTWEYNQYIRRAFIRPSLLQIIFHYWKKETGYAQAHPVGTRFLRLSFSGWFIDYPLAE